MHVHSQNGSVRTELPKTMRRMKWVWMLSQRQQGVISERCCVCVCVFHIPHQTTQHRVEMRLTSLPRRQHGRQYLRRLDLWRFIVGSCSLYRPKINKSRRSRWAGLLISGTKHQMNHEWTLMGIFSGAVSPVQQPRLKTIKHEWNFKCEKNPNDNLSLAAR